MVKKSANLRKPRVFLTHTWVSDKEGRENHARVKLLNDKLKQTGEIETWFDEERMKSPITQAMSQGIDDSDAVIVCISRAYIEKCAKKGNDNCKMELDYAYKRKGQPRLIAVVMEKDCQDQTTWEGPVGLYLNQHLYVANKPQRFPKSAFINHAVLWSQVHLISTR
jgi:hypothetical protein